ncbi:HepT-like ribonuclease domain-containing protein [Leptolyngbya sp. AN03gr2]|uniref:HepT-like ribonuclease domain-containing protein n=1 Tax=unclassified Leptolyngbya TaxID=2650499 RepID=UPI003D310E2E
MSRDDASLLDIYEAGQQILSYAQGCDRSELQADKMRVSAILYQVLIIGEATKRLSSEFRSQHSEIPWSNMAGMRDTVAHEYDRIDFGILWGVVQNSIPELLELLKPLLPQESEGD